ncbi:MAG: hypothetical protein OHK0045_19840 [Raineya sp.]
MFVNFDTLPTNARVWIYQANRALTEQEQSEIIKFLSDFLENWTAHQQTLKASAKILNNFFILIALDEDYQAASGCSIDKQVHCIKQIEQQWGISLLDNTQVAYIFENQIKLIHFKEIKNAIAQNLIAPQTLIFNRNIATIQDLQHSWLVPAQTTWLKTYFHNVATS